MKYRPLKAAIFSACRHGTPNPKAFRHLHNTCWRLHTAIGEAGWRSLGLDSAVHYYDLRGALAGCFYFASLEMDRPVFATSYGGPSEYACIGAKEALDDSFGIIERLERSGRPDQRWLP